MLHAAAYAESACSLISPLPATKVRAVSARSAAKKQARRAASATPRWQSWVTAALIVHLFCLGLAVLSNAGGGVSRIGFSLRRIPLAPTYLKLLGIDVGYDFDLAGSMPRDGVHRLQVAAPGDEAAQAVLPDDGIRWGVRRQRYHRLAYHVAELDAAFSENSDLQTMLPLAVADAWLAQQGMPPQRYVLTVQRQLAPRWPAAPEEERERSPTATEGGEIPAGEATLTAAAAPVVIDLVYNAREEQYEGSRRQAPELTARSTAGGAAAPRENNDADETAGDPAAAEDAS